MLPSLLFFVAACGSQAIPMIDLIDNSNVTDCGYPAGWFTQSIDHLGSNNDTFQQKYYISSNYYKPGGPILLFQGEETTSLDCVDSTIMYDFAKELNGIAVVLEHRYFGESVPFGNNLTAYTHEQWKYLTLDNVMDDAVAFVNSIRKNVTGAGSAPVLAASGSYGAFLMTMFRQNRPETFTGVISSAPALRSFYGGNETNVDGEFNWWNYISRSYREQSSKAAAKIQTAFYALAERFANNDTATLQSELGLCQPIRDNSTATFAILADYLRQVYAYGLEFNYNIARPGRSPIAHPLETFVDIALHEEDVIQVLNRTNWAWYPKSAATIGEEFTCIDQYDGATLGKLSAPAIETTPFGYVTCTYVSFDAGSVHNDTIFLTTGSPSFLHTSSVNACIEEYGVSAPSSKYMYENYHFTDSDLESSTGIIFSLAQFDPTTAVSGEFSFAMPVRGDRYASKRIITTGMAHREDLFAQNERTKRTVRETNSIELQTFKDWIEEAKSAA